MDSHIGEPRISNCVCVNMLLQGHYLYTTSKPVFDGVGWGNTGCGSGGLIPTVLEDIWDGESERTEEGVFENPFDNAYGTVESPN